MARISVGAVAMIPKGEYNSTTTYTRLNVVSYRGALYTCKATCTGVNPDNTEYWQKTLESSGSTAKGVSYDNSTSGLSATNVKGALDELAERNGGVSGVKGSAENTYRQGEVNISPANIGAYSTSEVDTLLNGKQNSLTAGSGISIEANVVSSTLIIDSSLSGTSENPVQNKAVKVAIDNKANKTTSEEYTLVAENWIGDSAPYTYDLNIPTTTDVEVLLTNTATPSQVEMVTNAMISGNGNDNILRAWGEKPTENIQVVIRKVVK